MPRDTKHRQPPAQVSKAVEGTPFAWGGYGGRRREYRVGPKCETNSGQWICVTHGEVFDNQLQKDIHIGQYGGYAGQAHVLAWWCHTHGPEVP